MALILLLAAPAFGAGFAIPEQNARSTAMVGVGAASAEGASAIFFNPGALSFEDGISGEVSVLMLAPALVAEVGGTRHPATAAANFAPTLFAAAPVMERLYLGLGAFSAFGAHVKWPDDFPGRFDGSGSSLVTYTFNPTVSIRVNDDLGVGAGLDIVRAAVRLDRQLDFASTEGSLSLGGGTWGLGGNVGVEARMLDKRLRLGANYRSATSLTFNGIAAFDVPPELEAELRDQNVRTRIVLPHTLSFGVGFRAMPKLLLTAEGTYTTWSTIQSFVLNFEDDDRDQLLVRDWTNTVTVKAAAEYKATREISARFGLGYDQTPSPDATTSPGLPDASRVLVSAGGGYRMGNFGVDAGYLFAYLLPRGTSGEAFRATYSGTAHVVAVTVSFRQ